MQFIYNEEAKRDILTVEKELFKYLLKVRRHKVGDILKFKNFTDKILYSYRLIDLTKREAIFKLISQTEIETFSDKKRLEIAWSVIDSKMVEKTLPMLNELSVSKISFIYTDRSQRNFKINIARLKKILINSNQQCGRFDFMEFEIFDRLEDFLNSRDSITVIDFSDKKLSCKDELGEVVLIGAEGGFSESERYILKPYKKVGFNTDLILKSETAVVSIASKILL